jgi:hypothetical protein
MIKDPMVICDKCGKELGDCTKIRYCPDCCEMYLFGEAIPKE